LTELPDTKEETKDVDVEVTKPAKTEILQKAEEIMDEAHSYSVVHRGDLHLDSSLEASKEIEEPARESKLAITEKPSELSFFKVDQFDPKKDGLTTEAPSVDSTTLPPERKDPTTSTEEPRMEKDDTLIPKISPTLITTSSASTPSIETTAEAQVTTMEAELTTEFPAIEATTMETLKLFVNSSIATPPPKEIKEMLGHGENEFGGPHIKIIGEQMIDGSTEISLWEKIILGIRCSRQDCRDTLRSTDAPNRELSGKWSMTMRARRWAAEPDASGGCICRERITMS